MTPYAHPDYVQEDSSGQGVDAGWEYGSITSFGSEDDGEVESYDEADLTIPRPRGRCCGK